MERKQVKKIAALLLCYTIGAAFQALSLKADIGVCAVWDTISMNVYEIWGIKVGYVSIVLNCLLILLQCLLLGKDFRPARLLAIPMVLLFGFATNFFYYDLYTFEPASYLVRVLLCVISYLGLAVFIGVVTYLDLVTFPAEGLCTCLEHRAGIPFQRSRVAIDLLCMAVSVTLSLLFGTSLKVREGTAIGMLILGPAMGRCITFYRKHHFLE